MAMQWIGWGRAIVVVALVLASQAEAGSQQTTAVKSCIDIAVGTTGPGSRCIVPGSGRTTWFKDCQDCPEMVLLPKGHVALGSPDDEPGRSPGETRVHFQYSREIAIGRFAVTFAEWDACVADGGCNGYRPDDEGWGRGNRPVVNVNWSDANAYTLWLWRKTGKDYLLPDEGVREYATRAGTETAYWSGAAIGLDEANFDVPDRATRAAVSGLAAVHRPRSQTVPVDSFQANPWGLFGVHGNVWEWTSDCWSEQQHMVTRRTSYRMPPLPPCGRRAARGGSWNDLASETRSAARIGFAADSRNAQQGFRVVRSLR